MLMRMFGCKVRFVVRSAAMGGAALAGLNGVGCAGGNGVDWAEGSGLARETIEVDLSGWGYSDAVGVSYVRSVEGEGAGGAGGLVIYVHGTPGSARAFGRYLVEGIGSTRGVALDRPGFGESGPEGGGSVPEFGAQAAAVAALIPDGERAVLVGHSLGGPIIARAAADYPERVGGLVILSGSLDPALEKPRWFNYAGGAVRGLLSREMRNSNDEIMAAPAETGALGLVLDRVVCPVAIVHGTEDSLVPIGNVQYMERAFVRAAEVSVRVLDGEGHFIPWKREAECRDAIGWVVERAGG